MAANYAKDCKSTVIPALRYRDAHRAIDFLVAAFGFEKQAVFDGPDGTVMHAQLTFGNGMVMLGSASNEGEWNEWMAQPDEIGGREGEGSRRADRHGTGRNALRRQSLRLYRLGGAPVVHWGV